MTSPTQKRNSQKFPVKHPHKYQRTNLASKPGKKYFVWRCTCGHYVRSKMLEGKQAECWDCGEGFVIGKAGKGYPARLKCEECSRVEKREVSEIARILSEADV